MVNMKTLLPLFFALVGFNSFAFAGSIAPAPEERSATEIASKDTQSTSLETYRLIQDIVQASIPKDSRAEVLELRLKAQDEKIKALEKEIVKLSGPDDISAPSLVLAAVSVIITVLGVLIAILSIFGYTNIRDESVKSAKLTAEETIAEVARLGLQDATETSLIKLIEEGRFDEIIKHAVASIAYRGISIPDGLADEEQKL